MKLIIGLILITTLAACNNVVSSGSDAQTKDSVVLRSENIPEERENVNAQPVKSYAETVKSFETTDEFKVSLYETKSTFKYRIRISYKQMEAEDTLRVPNFGMQPAVDIIKGDSIRPSCIIGFLDKDKKFRESKLVYFKRDKLTIKVLKYYGVYRSE